MCTMLTLTSSCQSWTASPSRLKHQTSHFSPAYFSDSDSEGCKLYDVRRMALNAHHWLPEMVRSSLLQQESGNTAFLTLVSL